jgi:hypothetical protein
MPTQVNIPKASSAVNVANTVATIVEIGTGIATTIATVSDDRQRANFQQNLQLLTNEQQLVLAKALNNAKSQDERLKILASALTNISNQRINNLQEIISQQEKNRRNLLVTNAIKVSALIIVSGFVIYLVSKK